MQEIEKSLSSLIDKVMSEGTEQQKCMLKHQVIKLVCRLNQLDPAAVKEAEEVLEAMNWHNYLTEREAKMIIVKMQPKPAWPTFETWKNMMDDADYEYSEKKRYNAYALFVAMNMEYSDSAKSICQVAGKPLKEIPEDEMFGYVYLFALDKLKDEDGIFSIRSYFHLDTMMK